MHTRINHFRSPICHADKRSTQGTAKSLPLGGNGWVFGYDNDYAHCHFHGVTMDDRRGDGAVRFSFIGYRAVAACQQFRYTDYSRKAEALWDAILNEPADPRNRTVQELVDGGFLSHENGTLRANFPVLTEANYQRL